MKRIKLLLIATTALTLAMPLAGCMRGDSGNAATPDVDQRIETLSEENEGCPDGKCPRNDSKDGECPDGKCPEKIGGNVDKLPEDGDNCPDGKCPEKRLPPPHFRHGNGHAVPLPSPHRGK